MFNKNNTISAFCMSFDMNNNKYMIKLFLKIKNKIQKLDKVAKNPFIQDDLSYNPCQNCIAQTYVWIEEDIKNNFATNPFVKKKLN